MVRVVAYALILQTMTLRLVEDHMRLEGEVLWEAKGEEDALVRLDTMQALS